MRYIILASFALCATACNKPDEQQLSMQRAARNCAEWVKQEIKNPNSATIPGAQVLGRRGNYIVVGWGRGDGLLLMNDFGAKLDSEAHCVMTDDGNFLKELVIDDRIIKTSL